MDISLKSVHQDRFLSQKNRTKYREVGMEGCYICNKRKKNSYAYLLADVHDKTVASRENNLVV